MSRYYYTPIKIKTTKEGTRSLIETIPAVIGEGTYGCVHKPSLRCDKKKVNYEGKISKLGTKKHINEEISEYKTINRVDRRAIFYPGTPNHCLPMRDPPTLEAIDKCRDFDSSHVGHYKLLVMNDGGENLEDFAKNIKSRIESESSANKIELRQKMEKFWIEAHRMFLGISKFLNAGIVHHDLKHKNIVYNLELNRINFIDFGLMTTVDTIKQESKHSKYGFSIRHWSFPPEMLFINYKRFLKFTDTVSTIPSIDKSKSKSKTTKSIEKTPRQKEFAQFLNELKNPNSHLNTFFMITDADFSKKKQNSFEVQEHTNEYYRMVMNSLHKNEYNQFLQKTVDTIDSYGLAIGLIYVLNQTRSILEERFANDLHFLFLNMMNFNVMERITIEEAMSRYEDILENNGILDKYNRHFEDHQLKINSEAIQKIKSKLNSIKIPNIKISQKRLESDPITKCPPLTKFDKKRKRCILSESAQSRSRSYRKSKRNMSKTVESKQNVTKKSRKSSNNSKISINL